MLALMLAAMLGAALLGAATLRAALLSLASIPSRTTRSRPCALALSSAWSARCKSTCNDEVSVGIRAANPMDTVMFTAVPLAV